VTTLRVRPNLADYTPEERALILRATKVYFPTYLFVEALDAMGKPTFPSVHCYRHLGDKVKQMNLFQLLSVPMPRTRVFHGPRQHERIEREFRFPFVAKVPKGSSRGEGVSLIRNSGDLAAYLRTTRVAYIQEYIPLRRDMRIVVMGQRVVHAYWKEAAPGEFRTNVARGGRVRLDLVSEEASALTRDVAVRCGFDHVGFDLCEDQGRLVVLEANMVFGTEGFRAAGLDYRALLGSMVESGEI
jgi:ribosomal protein S6--L-glutamate ligase